jgi:hypothetical protein
VINEGLSEINGVFPVPTLRENRERNDSPEAREEATGPSAVCKPRLPSIIVIGSRSIIVTTLNFSLKRAAMSVRLRCGNQQCLYCEIMLLT